MHPQYLKGLVDGIGFLLKFQKVMKPIVFKISIEYFRLLYKLGIPFLFLVCITLPGFSYNIIQPHPNKCYFYEKEYHLCDLKEKPRYIEKIKNEIWYLQLNKKAVIVRLRQGDSDNLESALEYDDAEIAKLQSYLPN